MHLIAVDTLECMGRLVGLASSHQAEGAGSMLGMLGRLGARCISGDSIARSSSTNWEADGLQQEAQRGGWRAAGVERQATHRPGNGSSSSSSSRRNRTACRPARNCHLLGQHVSQNPPGAREHANTPGAGVLAPAARHEVLQAGGYAWGHIGAVLVLGHLDDDLHAGEVTVQLLPAAQLPHCRAGKEEAGRQAGAARVG